jgi:hypothetical protein
MRFLNAPVRDKRTGEPVNINDATALQVALDLCKDAAHDFGGTVEHLRRLYTTSLLRPAEIRAVKLKIVENTLSQVEVMLHKFAAHSAFAHDAELADVCKVDCSHVEELLERAKVLLDEVEGTGDKQAIAKLKVRMLMLYMEAHQAGVLKIVYLAGHKTLLTAAARDVGSPESARVARVWKEFDQKNNVSYNPNPTKSKRLKVKG